MESQQNTHSGAVVPWLGLVSILAGLGFLGACASTGPQSGEEISDAALAAIASGDVKAYQSLVLNAETFKMVCPSWEKTWSVRRLSQLSARTKRRVARTLGDECSKALLDGAIRGTTEVLVTDSKHSEVCPETVSRMSSVTLFRKDGAPVEVVVGGIIGNPERGKWGIIGTPRCTVMNGAACQEVATIACQRVGEAAPECKKARESAANASADDQKLCKMVLDLVRLRKK